MSATTASTTRLVERESKFVRVVRGILLAALLVGGAALSIWSVAGAQEVQAQAIEEALRPQEQVDRDDDSAIQQQQPGEDGALVRTQDERLRGLVEDLGASSYRVREEATRQLLELGRAAIPFLEQGIESNDPERSWRAREVLEQIRQQRPSVREDRLEDEERNRADRRGPFWRRGRLPMGPEFEMESLRRSLEDLERWMDEVFDESRRRQTQFRRGRLFDRSAFDRMFERMEAFGRDSVGGSEQLDRWIEDLERFSEERGHVEIWRDGERIFDRTFGRESADSSAIGVVVETVEPALRAQLSLAEGEGLVVQRVREESRAAEAGIQQYDILLRVGNKPIRSAVDLRNAWREAESSISVTVLRKGVEQQIEIDQ